MADQENSKGWLETVIEGGLPQIIAGPAGKAISRLIGAGVEIPAAWLEQKAQAIRDETEAASTLSKALAEKAAERGCTDEVMLDRGISNLIGKAYREQERREDVARKTAEYIKEDAAPEDSPGPSDDWMDSFEDYVSKASSESIRDMFARVLAGEIRSPGHFSRATLHFVSVLDTKVAKLIEKVAPYVIDGSFIPRDFDKIELSYEKWLVLEEAGFVTLGSGQLVLKFDGANPRDSLFRFGNTGLLFKSKPDKQITLKAIKLTSAGSQLITTINPSFKIDEIIEWFWSHDPDGLSLGKVTKGWDGREVLVNTVPLVRT